METNTSKKSTWFRKISHNSLFSLLLPLSSCCLSWLSFFSMPSISISQTDRQRRTGKTPEPSISILTFSPFCITIIYPAYPVWFDRARRMQRWQTSGARVRRYSPVVMKVNRILLVAQMTKWWHWYPKGQRSTSQWHHLVLNTVLQDGSSTGSQRPSTAKLQADVTVLDTTRSITMQNLIAWNVAAGQVFFF